MDHVLVAGDDSRPNERGAWFFAAQQGPFGANRAENIVNTVDGGGAGLGKGHDVAAMT